MHELTGRQRDHQVFPIKSDAGKGGIAFVHQEHGPPKTALDEEVKPCGQQDGKHQIVHIAEDGAAQFLLKFREGGHGYAAPHEKASVQIPMRWTRYEASGQSVSGRRARRKIHPPTS